MDTKRPATKRPNGLPETIRQVKEQVSMEDLLAHLGVDLPDWKSTNKDGWRSVFCPIHDDGQHPSARYTDDLEDGDGNKVSKFWCPVCIISHDRETGEDLHSGDQLDLVQKALGKGLSAATTWLIHELKLEIKRPKRPKAPKRPEDREPPYPEDWPRSEEWTQNHWDRIRERWMPVARAGIAPKDDRMSLGEVFTLLRKVGRLDELDVRLREVIDYAVLTYDRSEAGFTTWLQLLVRRRVIDWLKTEIRADRLGVVLNPDDPRFRDKGAITARTPRGGLKQLRVPSSESQWAAGIDWEHMILFIWTRLGGLYARLAWHRFGEGWTVRECAEGLGVSIATANRMQKEIKKLVESERIIGREVAALRQEVGGP